MSSDDAAGMHVPSRRARMCVLNAAQKLVLSERTKKAAQGTVSLGCDFVWSRGWESNPQPLVYKTRALPLSYTGGDCTPRRAPRAREVRAPSHSTRNISLSHLGWAGLRFSPLPKWHQRAPGHHSAPTSPSPQNSRNESATIFTAQSRTMPRPSTHVRKKPTSTSQYGETVIWIRPARGITLTSSCPYRIIPSAAVSNGPEQRLENGMGMWHSGNCGGL